MIKATKVYSCLQSTKKFGARQEHYFHWEKLFGRIEMKG